MKAVGNDAEVALPGTNWIAIVKSGGNDFHGQYFVCRRAVGDPEQQHRRRAAGAGRHDRATALRYVTDLAADLGGRIVRDKLWFYGALPRSAPAERSDRLRRGRRARTASDGTADDRAGVPGS